jgi:RimJ/RimL family protein N-acetyltransferase
VLDRPQRIGDVLAMDHPRTGPAYRIETDRLVVRCYQPSDAALLKAAIDASLDALRPWMPWAHNEPQPVAEKVSLLRQFRGRFDLGQDFVYGAFDRAETESLGSSGLHARLGPGAREIGYWVHAAHAGKGLATEIAGALTRTGFEIEQLHRIEIHCSPDNARSMAVARKLGYVHEATLRERFEQPDGSRRDTMIWTMFARDYPASPAAATRLRAFDVTGQPLL